MAVRIPTYQQQQAPNSLGPMPQARGVDVATIGNSLQRLGAAADDAVLAVLKVDQRNAELDQKKADDDAISQAGRTISDATLHWDQYLKDASQNAPNGAAGFTPKVIGEFDKYADQTLAGITNERARKWAQSHLLSLRTSIGARAIGFEAQAGVAQRDQNLEETYQNLARLAAQDPGQYEIGRQILLSTIANMGYEPTTRAARAKTYLERYGEAALTGATQKAPDSVKTAVDDIYAKISPAAAAGAPALPGAPAPAAAKVTRNPDGTVVLATDPALPAGMRNNNPGNIIFARQADALGPSVNRDNNGKSPQAVYATPEAGMAAMFQLALKKYDAGKKSAADLISAPGGWTPGNPQAGANIAAAMGLKPGDDMNLRDPAQLAKFARALITQEQGKPGQAYSDQMIASVAADVLAGRKPGGASPAAAAASPAQRAAPVDPVLSRIVADVNVDRLPAFATHAQTEINRQMATYRSQLSTTEGDHVAAWMNGDPVQKPLSEGDYVKAYGPVEGPQRFANYQQIAVMGSDMQALKLATPAQTEALVAKYQPQPGQPGYELATKRYDMVVKAADAVNKQRQTDPMLYAQQAKIGNAGPLNFNDQSAFGAELNKRQGVAATMAQTYQAPYALLSKAEATVLNEGFQRMTTQQKLGYLDTIRKSVTDPTAFRSVMQQVAPDSPVTAMAGIIQSKRDSVTRSSWFGMSSEVFKSQDVAAIMLEGEALMNPTKTAKGENGTGKTFPMPKEQDIRDAFSSQLGKAFAGDPNGAAFAFQAVKAYYAGKAARDGDITGNLDAGRLKDAITAVTGGVTDVNGKGEVLRPWGMDEALFKNAIKASFDKAMKDNGYQGTQLDVFGAYGLQSIGDSKYLVLSGLQSLTDRQGRPVVLDLTYPEPPAIPRASAPPFPTSAPAPATPQERPAFERVDARTVRGVVSPAARPVTQQPKTK